MDFIVFMSIYVVVFIITTILYYSCDAAIVKSSLYRGFISLAKFLFGLIPGFIKNNICGGFDHLFYKRNHVFQIIYGSLVLAGHVVLVLDIFPIVYTLAAHENHVTVPLILVLANTVFFNLTCSTDPGEITPASVKHFSPAYCYDMIMYKPNMKCRTCHTAKLPRSKHCSICDRCVYRFDHHCIWTNNCIGGLNHCYFVLFLLSICVMSINGVFVCWNCLMLVVGHYKMLDTSYMDGAGNIQPVTVLVLAQHLFMKFPRIVFTLVSLTFVIALLGGFTLYHVFLLLTNQTTNERYKTSLPESQPQKPKPSLNGRFRRPPKPKKFDRYVYSKGFSQNLYEVIFPKSFLKDKVKDKYC